MTIEHKARTTSMRRRRLPHVERGVQFGRSDLPPKQRAALKKAIRWELFTIVPSEQLPVEADCGFMNEKGMR